MKCKCFYLPADNRVKTLANPWLDERTTLCYAGGIMTKLDKKLLEILVCPATKGPLRYDEAAQELISTQAKLAYPIRDGIPIMLKEEARPIE